MKRRGQVRARQAVRGTLVRVLVLLAMAAGLLALQFPYRTLAEETSSLNRASATLKTLNEENRALKKEIAELNSPEHVGLVAREDLKLVPPGAVPVAVVPSGSAGILNDLPTRITPSGPEFGTESIKKRSPGGPSFLSRFVRVLEFWR